MTNFRGHSLGHIAISKETGKQLWHVSYIPKPEDGDTTVVLVSAFKGTDGIYLNWLETKDGARSQASVRLTVSQVAYLMRIMTDAIRWADTERPTWYETNAINEANERCRIAERELKRVRRTLWARFNESLDRVRARRDDARRLRHVERMQKAIEKSFNRQLREQEPR